MRRLIFFFTFCLFQITLFANESIFTFTSSDYAITNNIENTRVLKIKRNLLDKLFNSGLHKFALEVPLIDGRYINVDLQQFNVISDNHRLMIETEKGKIIEDFNSDFNSYYILYNGKSIGTFLIFENSIIITYLLNGRQFEINKIDNQYFLFDVNDCVVQNTFSCQVEEKINQLNINNNRSNSNVLTPKCLELAVEVDYYTRNTFNSNVATTSWAHAIVAGVSQVYASEVNLNVSISSTIVWQVTDPYASYVNDASNMLSALKNHWISNNSSISRDLVHLLTKRSNTGTGGIAYRDVLCDNTWGYGFSSDLNNSTNFNFPNPSYTWNLMVCSHEIGHNIESHHTHWCGWPGGPIDNCEDVEGNCTNNPTPQVGTIMSYCHVGGNGIIIDFHPTVVANALITGINSSSCLTACAFYGCTDPSANNYDLNATVDDGSCLYFPVVSAVVTDVSCFGFSDGSIDLSISGGVAPFTFLWNNGATSEDISGLFDGTYSVTITDAIGQTENISLTILSPPEIIYSFTAYPPSAPGYNDGYILSTIIGGVAPYSYSWSGPNNYNSTVLNPQNLFSGLYTCNVIDANNCYQSFSVFVNEGQLSTIEVSDSINDVMCFGESNGSIYLTASGGASPYSFSWSNGAILQNINLLSAGSYNVVVTDAFNQTLSLTYTVNEPDLLTASYNVTNVTSAGGNDGAIDITPNGGIIPYSYFWSTLPTQNTQDINNLTAGIYTLWLVDANNCFVAIDIDVVEDLTSSLCAGSAITGLSVSDIIHDRATFNFDNMNTYDATGAQVCRVDQIRIKYRPVGTSSWSQKNMAQPTGYDAVTGICNSTQNTAKITRNLMSSTTYEWEVKVWYCDGQNSGFVAGPNFTTLDDCPNVGNLTAYGATPTKATFTWDNSNGAYSFVRLKARVDSISNPTGSDFFQIGGAGVSYGIYTKNKQNMVPGETYRGQARTYCDPNGGPYRSPSWSPLVFWTQPTVRIEGGVSIANLDVYPNPSEGTFNISFSSETIQSIDIRIMNVMGEEIVSEKTEQFIGEYTKKITLENQSKGIYFLEIKTKNEIINKKLILQ
jgi:hypothetical protein